ncbi:hypothetical protein BOO69_16865 [Sulfitobacter alexandrii]|uniref:Uncharacterized protein n=1 Tax=Sulfitobacter alexandrii TaxID=1917485 RepID=A0A1J0WKR5_9RHOB|nr:hypothetical protein [Sulfitobacter alexandrii]APE44890.1 hypothetical protein BOO69_16865 [Sulfitobacter alexandrii]
MHVLQMNPVEKVRVDAAQLEALYAQLGPAEAEDVLCRALEDVALRLGHCVSLFEQGSLADLRKNARTLIAVGDQIGMLALNRVATDVVGCIDRRDDVALAATLSRLLRVGERSLCAVWNTGDNAIR